MNEKCPLCFNETSLFAEVGEREFYQCSTCKGIHLPKKYFLDENAELNVYERHVNDVNDSRYQSFTSPIWEQVLKDFTKKDHGLDFGCGTGPVISKMLQDKGYQVAQYDPFFANHPQLLEKQYNYIFSCEVVEHFHRPNTEFQRLKNMLLPGGKLYLMTHHYNESTCGPFEDWYYIKDPTHVFIYTAETFDWIRNAFGFSRVEVGLRLIVFLI